MKVDKSAYEIYAIEVCPNMFYDSGAQDGEVTRLYTLNQCKLFTDKVKADRILESFSIYNKRKFPTAKVIKFNLVRDIKEINS